MRRSTHARTGRATAAPMGTVAPAEALERRTLLAATFTVTTTADSGAGSLRQAISDANASPGIDTIQFAIGSGSRTIAPTSALPAVTEGVVIDATAQPGYAGKPIIELSGAAIPASSQTNGLMLSGGNVTVKGLVVDRWGGFGIWITQNGHDVVQNCFVGTDLTGSLSGYGNAGNGIYCDSADNLIGGPSASQRNVLSGNGGMGVFIIGGGAVRNTIQNNFIGTDVTGTKALGNGDNGIMVEDGSNTNILGNVVSANLVDGIFIFGGAYANIIQGNYVGTDYTGTQGLGNGYNGNSLLGYGLECQTAYNTIGGTLPGQGNVFSGNTQSGIVLHSPPQNRTSCHDNTVQGNLCGTDVTGGKAIPNLQQGLALDHAFNNIVGGTTLAARNVLSGNVGSGLGVLDGSHDNTIQGNYVGTDATGNVALGNDFGIGFFPFVDAAGGNLVGGSAGGAGNVVSGNRNAGIFLLGLSSGTTIQGNVVGLSASGFLAVPNATDGIFVDVNNTTVGGDTAAAGNVVGGNTANGIAIADAATGTLVRNNRIGTTDAAGTLSLGNGGAGVMVSNAASGNVIQSNTIAYNSTGVTVDAHGSTTDPVGNRITGNSIFRNRKLGIDLGADGVTLNDAGDADTGPNGLQNFPVLASIGGSGDNVVTGWLNSTTNATFTLEFFWSATAGLGGFGQGMTPVGTTTVTTDAGGNASFTYTIAAAMPAGGVITATATDAAGSTSEFGIAATRLPHVTAAAYVESAPNHQLRFTFSHDLSASISAAAFKVTSLTTGAMIAPAGFAYDAVSRTATLTFAGALPEGSYQCCVRAAALSGPAGQAFDGLGNGAGRTDYVFAFTHLTGDANHDGVVDLKDMLIVTGHIGQAGGYAAGDFDGDGTVTFADFQTVAANMGHRLPALSPAAVAAAAVPSMVTTVAPPPSRGRSATTPTTSTSATATSAATIGPAPIPLLVVSPSSSATLLRAADGSLLSCSS